MDAAALLKEADRLRAQAECRVEMSERGVAALLAARAALDSMSKDAPKDLRAIMDFAFDPAIPVDKAETLELLGDCLLELRADITAGPMADAISKSLTALAEIVGVDKASWTDSYLAGLPDTAYAIVRRKKGKGTEVLSRHVPHHMRGCADSRDHKTVDLKLLAWHMAHINAHTSLTPAEKDRAAKHLRFHARGLNLTAAGKAKVVKLDLMEGEDYYAFREALECELFEMVNAMSVMDARAKFGFSGSSDSGPDEYPRLHIDVVFNDFVIATEGWSSGCKWKIGFTRDAQGEFTLAEPVQVEEIRTFEEVTPETEMMKAQWTAKYINDMPDAAFAYIENGGTKDESGKTVPRSLRYLPHHDKSVTNGSDNDTVDLPHLKNALARLPQSNLSAAAKAKALKHLQAHAKALNVGEAAEPEKKVKKLDGTGTVFAHMRHSEIRKVDGVDEQIVGGVVLEPNDGGDGKAVDPDTQGDVYSLDDVRKACHSFALHGSHHKVLHAAAGDGKIVTLESYIAPQDLRYADTDEVIKAGSWVLIAKINDNDLWAKVKAGQFNGWSVGGTAVRTAVEEEAAA